MPVPRFDRRRFLAAFGALGAAFAIHPAGAQAAPEQEYPNRVVRLIVPYSAGGSTDILARLIAKELKDSWGQPVIVENRPGASGTIGIGATAKAPADGYTAVIAITTMILQTPELMPHINYSVERDLRPLVKVAETALVFAVPKDMPVDTLEEFVALVKAKPGAYSYGSFGIATSAHIQGELLKLQTGLDMVHVPYAGAAPLIQDLRGNQVHSAFIDVPTMKPHLDSLKVLALTGVERHPGLPGVRTFAEMGYHSFEPIGWWGLFMPAGVPDAVAGQFSAEVQRILRKPEVIERIQAMAIAPGSVSSEAFAHMVQRDSGIYRRIIQEANIGLQ